PPPAMVMDWGKGRCRGRERGPSPSKQSPEGMTPMKTIFTMQGTRSRVLAMFAVALAVSLAPAGAAMAAGKQKNLYMVSVGITNAIGQPVQTATKKDALDMAAWARSQKGKLFGETHVTSITNSQATGKRILSALSGLQSKADDTVIFYISSHG